MAQRALEIGASGCGITDHGNVTGHLVFSDTMHSYGLKPVFGVELYHGLLTKPEKQRDQAHLIALAKNNEGLQNLWRLMHQTSRNDHFHHVGRVFKEDLERYHKGIIFTSACALGLVPKQIIQGDYSMLDWYLSTFGDDFYIEISTYPATQEFQDNEQEQSMNMRIYNEALVAIAQERGLPLIYGDDGHYAYPSDFEFHDAYLARQTGQTIYTPIEERKMYHPPGAVVIKDLEMIYANLDYLPKMVIDEAIENANTIIEKSTAGLPSVRRHLPAYVPKTSPWILPEQKALSAEELFIDLVMAGITKRYPQANEEVWQRVAYEIEVLMRDGIHHYFLMGWDEMQIADSLGIERGPGRGSSAGSIVAYALGITDVEPLHYGLIFERFWNSGRVDGLPDIDSDFSRSRRDEMILALKERWGENRVAAIGTTGYLKPKAVIDKLATTCGISYAEADELKEIVGRTTKIDILGHDQIGWTREREPGKKYYVKEEVGDAIDQWIKAQPGAEDVRAYFVHCCEATCSRPSQFGIHASGLVVSDTDLDAELPAQVRGGKTGVAATMFTMSDIDKRQFVKLDVLGLRTLDVLDFWRQDMQAKYDVQIEWSGLDLLEHDPDMWKMVHKGLTAGVFQIEDGYGRQLCQRMPPNSVMDLAVIGALNRPGPIQAGIPDEYVARMRGDKEVIYPHVVFETLMSKHLDRTYGLWVFQEQIIAYFNELGYSLSESDAIRKIMGKKKPEQLDAIRDGLGEWQGRGYLDMAQAAGIPKDVVATIWLELEGFADYCFNLAHSVAYGIITFRTIYAKYYGPVEFYTAVLRSLESTADGPKRKALLPVIINECRRQGIEVLPPDILKSKAYPYCEDNRIYFGFTDIAGVGNSGEYIELLREKLDCSSYQAFAESFAAYNEAWAMDKKTNPAIYTGSRSPKQQLTAKKIEALRMVGAWNALEGHQHSLVDQQQAELELLGVILTLNTQEILDRHQEEIEACDDYEDALVPWEQKGDSLDFIDYYLPGVVCNIAEKTVRKTGNRFAIITLIYAEHELTMTCFSGLWRHIKPIFKIGSVGLFEIRHGPDNQYGPSYVFRNGTRLQ